jgi:nitrogen fixation NifU-like protein
MDMYQEEILEHYRHPHNRGTIAHADRIQKERNPVCGDELTFYLTIADGKITDVKFEGQGCAISQASASMLTDEIIGKPVEVVKSMQKEAVLDLLGIELGPTRLKCALLSLQGITRALTTAQTE